MRASADDEIYDSAVEVIGDTPLVELGRLTRGMPGRVVAKLEFLNPGHSKKDRIARQIISDAEESGDLKPGQTVVELTSGNTGTGLAIVCAVRGYPFVAVMSRGNSSERMHMMTALGAEVVLVDQISGVSGHVTGDDVAALELVAQRIVAERGAFRADQFRLRGNFRAHYLHTGEEILRQSAGRVDVFCDFVGTGGTFGGCAARFKEYRSSITCYVVEPEGASALAGKPITNTRHRIQGGGYSLQDLEMIDRRHIDGFLTVSDEEAIEMARQLARVEGLFVGFSAGANVAVALRLLRGKHRGMSIAVLLPDSGLKYLSTDLWR